MIKVSVIIPVYNTEKYLKRCLDSITGQTLEDIEIICVDDGSTDGSLRILEEYSVRDNRINVIHKENGGAFSARRAGEFAAQGQYIGYVDSDDWVEPDMYERLYTSACANNVEMVTSGYFFEGNYISEIYDALEEGLYLQERMQYVRNNTIYYLSKKEKGLRGSQCCKLFSKNLLERTQCSIPEEVTIGEDELCILTYVLNCRSALVLKKAYYHYMINSGSSVHTSNQDYLIAVNSLYKYLVTLYNHPNFTETMRMQSELYIMELLLKGMNSLMGFQTRNLLWFDPYWLDKLPGGSKVVLYGTGEAGRKCRKQLLLRDDLQYAGCIDFGYEHVHDDELGVAAPMALKSLDYDYIVITIKNPAKAEQIRQQLEELGTAPEKILWFEQRELFWRYAEAEGLLKNLEGTV